MLHHEELAGQGAPILLLHGIFSSSDVWRPVAKRLATAGSRVVLLDARGHGRSGAPDSGMDWSPLAAAADALGFVRAHLPEGAHVVGHSRGGTAASWMAFEAPELVKSLAVVCSPPEASEAFRALHRRALEALSPEAPWSNREALSYLARIPDDAFPTQALRRYPGAALVVEAGDDPYYSPTHTLFWRAYLPYATFARLDGGHDFFTTPAGADALAALILRHVEGAQRRS